MIFKKIRFKKTSIDFVVLVRDLFCFNLIFKDFARSLKEKLKMKVEEKYK